MNKMAWIIMTSAVLLACTGQRAATEAEKVKASQNLAVALNPICSAGLVACAGQTEQVARCIVDGSDDADVIELAQKVALQDLGLVSSMIASGPGLACVLGDIDVNSPASFALQAALAGLS